MTETEPKIRILKTPKPDSPNDYSRHYPDGVRYRVWRWGEYGFLGKLLHPKNDDTALEFCFSVGFDGDDLKLQYEVFNETDHGPEFDRAVIQDICHDLIYTAVEAVPAP